MEEKVTNPETKVEVENKATPEVAPKKEDARPRGKGPRRDDRRARRPRAEEVKEYEEIVVDINRVAKTVKGGRKVRFSALMVIGNKTGKFGFGMGKAGEVPDAI